MLNSDKRELASRRKTPSSQELALLPETGSIYREMDRFEQAREVFAGGPALLPSNELPEIALGTISLREGDFDMAIRFYKMAIEKNPRSGCAHAYLGEAQIFRLEKAGAYESLQKAIEL